MLTIGSFSNSRIALSLAFILLSGSAMAQVPASVDAGRMQESIKRDMAPGSVKVPIDLSTTPDVKAPAGAEKVKLTLKHVIVEGATKLSQDTMRAAYAGQLNKTITLADVYGIANRITAMYRNAGYLLSRAVVPQQEIKNGTVRIRIVEGFIHSYSIKGGDFAGRAQLEAYAKKLTSSGTLNAQNLERYLLLMNDIPGLKVRSVLTPSSVAGGADMTLIVEERKLQGFAGIDNFGNTYIGPERLTAGGQINRPFSTSGQLNGALMWAPNHDELRYYSAGYSQTVGDEGTKLGANVTYTETDPTLPLALGGALDPHGKAFNINLRAEHPFIRSRNDNLIGGLSFDINRNRTLFGPGLGALETDDQQRILRANLQGSFLDRFMGYNTGNVTLSKGLEIFGSSKEGDAGLSRALGDPGFTKLNLDASRLQNISGPFTGFIGLTGQYASDALLSSEEFGFGGNEYGRGFDFSEMTGDHGVAGKVELAYNGKTEARFLNDYQVYTFYDMGKVWNRDPGAGQNSTDSASSAGIGSRLTFNPSVRGDAFIAKPLTRDVASRGNDGDDWRFKFSLISNF